MHDSLLNLICQAAECLVAEQIVLCSCATGLGVLITAYVVVAH